MACQVVNLPLIESKPGKHCWIRKVRLRVHLAVEESEDVLPVRVVEWRKIKLVYIAPVEVVAWLGEVFGANVGVEAVCQRIMNGLHMAACPTCRFQQYYVV